MRPTDRSLCCRQMRYDNERESRYSKHGSSAALPSGRPDFTRAGAIGANAGNFDAHTRSFACECHPHPRSDLLGPASAEQLASSGHTITPLPTHQCQPTIGASVSSLIQASPQTKLVPLCFSLAQCATVHLRQKRFGASDVQLTTDRRAKL